MKGHMELLEREGVQWFILRNLVPIALKPKWINVEDLPLETEFDKDAFPWLCMKTGFETKQIKALGGQHHCEALKMLFEKKKKETIMKQMMYNKGTAAVAKNKVDLVMVKLLEQEVEALKGYLKGLRVWGFTVYDLGA